jgi:hypothetical protein
MVAADLPLISTLFIPPSGRGLLEGQNHDPTQNRIDGAAKVCFIAPRVIAGAQDLRAVYKDSLR